MNAHENMKKCGNAVPTRSRPTTPLTVGIDYTKIYWIWNFQKKG